MKKSKIVAAVLTLAVTASIAGGMIYNGFKSKAAESSVETATISEILSNQNSDGGWKKNYATTSGDWSKSTIDNGATYTEIRKLAAEYADTKNTKYSNAAIKGIEFLIDMQYDNGGWPQVVGGSGYHAAITFNDNAMVNVMYLLDDVSKKSGDFSFVSSSLASQCKTSVEKGIQCLLKCQVTVNGKKTVWGQQHDKDSLKPTSARAYEVASLCSSESSAIVKFLTTRNATSEINASISAAVQWFKDTKITGIKVTKTSDDCVVTTDSSSTKAYWARFYELGTNKPIFVGRDGVVKYKISDIEQERRAGYSWYGSWGSSIITISTSQETAKATATPSATPTAKATATPTVEPTNTVSTSGNVHDFTTSGKSSSFFSITGNLSTSKGSITYNGLTLKQCLKLESSTKITFTNSSSATLTLVLNKSNSSNIKVDGTKYTCDSNGVITVNIPSGSHTIAKASSGNLYYISVK